MLATRDPDGRALPSAAVPGRGAHSVPSASALASAAWWGKRPGLRGEAAALDAAREGRGEAAVGPVLRVGDLRPWDPRLRVNPYIPGRRGPALRINEALRHLLPAAGCTDYSNVSPVIWDEGSDVWENRLVNSYSVVGGLRV